MSESVLFDPAFMHKLEQLSLAARQIRSGQYRGERRSTRRGQSIEFADYRNYTRGDDLRALDWNIYARLERPFIKLFEEEVDQTVHILLDASGSMDWPDSASDWRKWAYACRLGAALGYIALSNLERLYVAGLSAEEPLLWGPERRRSGIHSLLKFLAGTPAHGQTSLSAALTRYARQVKRPGLLFLLSDFLTTEDYQAGLSALQHQGHEITVIHLLSPDEVDPALSGDFELVDVETGASQDITVNAAMKKRYQRQFAAWQDNLVQFCRRRNIHYALVTTDQPFEALILGQFRRLGWIS